MRVIDIQYLNDYSSWANARLLAVVSRLSPDQFTRRIAGSYGSIRNTLVHMLSAEWGWLERCGGPPRGPRLSAENYPTVGTVLDMWRRVEGWMRDFLEELTEEELAQEVEFTLGEGAAQSLSRGELLHHAVIHGVHHRGQVALLLRELGYTPGNVDLLLYASERSKVPS